MEWNDDLKMVIDTSVGFDTEEIDKKEDLIGFTFDAALTTSDGEQDLILARLTKAQKSVMPKDDNSISTLGSIAKGFASPVGKQKHSKAFSTSNHSVFSTSSLVTMEQYNQLQEQVEKVSESSKTQFIAINDKVSQILSSISVLTAAHQPGSASAVTLQAGENNSSSSGGEQ